MINRVGSGLQERHPDIINDCCRKRSCRICACVNGYATVFRGRLIDYYVPEHDPFSVLSWHFQKFRVNSNACLFCLHVQRESGIGTRVDEMNIAKLQMHRQVPQPSAFSNCNAASSSASLADNSVNPDRPKLAGVCNPPFHSHKGPLREGSSRKRNAMSS